MAQRPPWVQPRQSRREVILGLRPQALHRCFYLGQDQLPITAPRAPRDGAIRAPATRLREGPTPALQRAPPEAGRARPRQADPLAATVEIAYSRATSLH